MPKFERLPGGIASATSELKTVTGTGRRQLRPGEKRQVGSGMPLRVRIKQVVGPGVILVHALLHQTHPEHAGIKIEIFLGGPGDGGGDVVQAVYSAHIRF